MMNKRFSYLYSTVCHSRILHQQFLKHQYIQSYHPCWKLLKKNMTIASTIHKTFCQSSKEKYVKIYPGISVKEIAENINVEPLSIMELLKDYDYDTSCDKKTILDFDMAELIADEYGFSVLKEENVQPVSRKHSLLPRPPVVTIMGHVDHGKTTLLDKLRNTSTALHEAGGITQSIAAFSVEVPGLDSHVTFVDTPGHLAFNLMRARSAQLTDIVVLVIAADDGIMAQTKESLRHINEANVPFIIAINKIDKANSNPNKVRKELLTNGIQLEEYGGNIKCVELSALKSTNIDALLHILNELSIENKYEASQEAPVEAVVVEVENNKRKGIVSTILLKQGKLTKGKVLIAGNAMVKVRQIYNFNGEIINAAFPSDPVQILGWRSLPTLGDTALEMGSEAEARNLLKLQALEAKPDKIIKKPLGRTLGKKSLTQEFKSGRTKRIPYRVQLRAQAASGLKAIADTHKEINVVIKADVSGSLEAVVGILSKFHSDHVKLNIINAAVGQPTITDLNLASTFNGIVYSFNIDPTKDISSQAKMLGIPLKYFNIIYKLLDDIKEEVDGILPSTIIENIIGEGEVLKVFKLTGSVKGVVGGCHVKEGLFDASNKNYLWRVVRDNKNIYEGVITSLKRGATDIPVAKKMSECGVILGKFEDFHAGDKLFCLEKEEVKRTFEWCL